MHCENCQIEHNGKYLNKRFCSYKCARAYSTKHDNSKEQKVTNCISCKKEIFINKRASIKTARCKECKNKNTKEKYLNNRKKKIKTCKFCNSIINEKHKSICNNCKLEYYGQFRRECGFIFHLNEFPNEFDFNLIKLYGWYKASNNGNNLNGISRDHIFSVKRAFEEKINPIFIKHPANCELIRHKDNQSKKSKCKLSYNELLIKIINFEEKYNYDINAYNSAKTSLDGRVI